VYFSSGFMFTPEDGSFAQSWKLLPQVVYEFLEVFSQRETQAALT